MQNVTIALEEEIVRKSRRIAAERSTSLNAMIRQYLEQLVDREAHAAKARRRIALLARRSGAEVGPRRWTRDELHER